MAAALKVDRRTYPQLPPKLTNGSQVPICLPREDDRLGWPRQMRLTVYAQPLLYGSLVINNTQLARLVGWASNP